MKKTWEKQGKYFVWRPHSYCEPNEEIMIPLDIERSILYEELMRDGTFNSFYLIGWLMYKGYMNTAYCILEILHKNDLNGYSGF